MILQAICQLTFFIVLNLRFGYLYKELCFKKGALNYGQSGFWRILYSFFAYMVGF